MSKFLNLNAVDWKKAGEKLILVLLGGLALFMEQSLAPILQQAIQEPFVLTIAFALNTSLIDLIRKFITDEEGKLGGVRLVIK